MGQVIDTTSLPWQLVRPNLAQGVEGKTLLDDSHKVILARARPGGRFTHHRDEYGHLFYFISGEGLMSLGEDLIEVEPGVAILVEAGELHAYKNTGREDLVLISINLPSHRKA
jgi:mannose-6-phosphate isomerase-like protein (cupin superfamily)